MSGVRTKFLMLLRRDGLVSVALRTVRHLRWQSQQLRRRIRGSMVVLNGNKVKIDGVSIDVSSAIVDMLVKGDLHFGSYESDERSLLKLLPSDFPLIELGGCLGVVSCIANRRLSRPECHLVVEANPSMVPSIERNRTLNNAHFRVINRAVGYSERDATFDVGRGVLNNSLSDAANANVISVPSISLARLCNDAGFEAFSLICDIEGAEIEMFLKELDLIRVKVRWIMVEMHPGISGQATVAETLSKIRAAGFLDVERSGDTFVFRKPAE